MSEEDVLAGRAIVILEVDDPKLLSESALKSHFRREYKNTAAEHIQKVQFDTKNSTSRNKNNDSDEVHNLAVVLFQDPTAVLFLLQERLTPRSHFQLNGIELRRGTLQLGRQSIVIEGCLRSDNNDSKQQQQQQQRQVSPHKGGSGSKQENSPQVRPSRPSSQPINDYNRHNNNNNNNANINNNSSRTENRHDPVHRPPSPKRESEERSRSGEDDLELEDPTEVRPRPPLQRSAVAEAPASSGRPKTKILFFIFTLLFCRPPTQRPAARPQDVDKIESRKHKDFDLTPFLVYQMLCDRARVYAIEVLPKVDANARQDITKVLVEVDTAAADDIVREFDQAFVDFMSPTSPLDVANGEGPETFGQRAEMRYRVYAMFSRDQHPIVEKPGQRNSFRSMRLTDDVLHAFHSPERHETAQFLLQPFSRRWCEDRGQPAPQHVQQEQQRFLQYATAQGGDGGQRAQKRGRSASPPGQAPQETPAAARPLQAMRVEQPQCNAFIAPGMNQNQQGVASGGFVQGSAVQVQQQQQRQIPPVNTYVPTASVSSTMAAGGNAYIQPPQQQQQQQPVAAAVTPSPVPMPPLFSDHQGPLPPYWRPVFSEEYKQVYYVYQHPSGEERTTWTRPTS